MNIIEQIKACEQEASAIRSKAASEARTLSRKSEIDCAAAAEELVARAKSQAHELVEKADSEGRARGTESLAAASALDEKLRANKAPLVDAVAKRIVEEVLTL